MSSRRLQTETLSDAGRHFAQVKQDRPFGETFNLTRTRTPAFRSTRFPDTRCARQKLNAQVVRTTWFFSERNSLNAPRGQPNSRMVQCSGESYLASGTP